MMGGFKFQILYFTYALAHDFYIKNSIILNDKKKENEEDSIALKMEN